MLVAVSGLGYLASQTLMARPPLVPGDLPAYVAAPVPARTTPSVAPGQPLGRPRVDPNWLARTATRTGIPPTALRAYAVAQLSDAGGCDVGWTTLAGVGWVESQHGTLGGRTLRPGGRSSTPILGPALDGRRFAAIRSTPGSQAWHGDPRWEHAVGPMQFLPGTWATWATDGDGDGRTSPLDLDDAAAATARYLCADGHDLTTGDGWAAAIFSYNHDQAYVDAVHAAAVTYAQRAG
ncbi:lytic murein transglycosylase [Nocardioides sp. KIGAM211]|uniref:Lytic murein transglycosylase n=2 Tax=Nocardioides luti TaxID=2761101 RepID=A0A7X0V9V3_9ACTN|nr:lytic murein transglycosylase [Nocardioides luti]MBB6627059.1 lytic murein transglycosylase [Nocardioides luti]